MGLLPEKECSAFATRLYHRQRINQMEAQPACRRDQEGELKRADSGSDSPWSRIRLISTKLLRGYSQIMWKTV
jgi:hypothetical protein